MRLVIVPNHVRDAINDALDRKLVLWPEAAGDREKLYQQLLAYFDEFGVVPDFAITKRKEAS